MITHIILSLLIGMLPVCAEEDSVNCAWTNDGRTYITITTE